MADVDEQHFAHRQAVFADLRSSIATAAALDAAVSGVGGDPAVRPGPLVFRAIPRFPGRAPIGRRSGRARPNGKQVLRHNRAEHPGELAAHALVVLRRERGQQPLDRADGIVGMHRRQDQVTGLGRGDGGADGVLVAHLAHHDDVRVLPQRRDERIVEAAGVNAHLPLIDQARGRLVDELDRVLDRDDVPAARLIDAVHQRGHGRAFPGAGGPGEDDQAVLQRAKLHRAFPACAAPRAS